MIIYIINVLYDGLVNLNKAKKDFEIVKDAKYIAGLAEVKKTCNSIEIHQKLLDVVERFNKYYVSSNDIMEVLKKLLLNVHNQWIIDKYNETFYKYICKDRIEIASLISKNLLVANQLAISG